MEILRFETHLYNTIYLKINIKLHLAWDADDGCYLETICRKTENFGMKIQNNMNYNTNLVENVFAYECFTCLIETELFNHRMSTDR